MFHLEGGGNLGGIEAISEIAVYGVRSDARRNTHLLVLLEGTAWRQDLSDQLRTAVPIRQTRLSSRTFVIRRESEALPAHASAERRALKTREGERSRCAPVVWPHHLFRLCGVTAPN
jgi:hypothetical protein